jgi:hypothetical protein
LAIRLVGIIVILFKQEILVSDRPVSTVSTSSFDLMLHLFISVVPSILLNLLMFLFYHMLCSLYIIFLFVPDLVVMKCTLMSFHDCPPLGVQWPKGLMTIERVRVPGIDLEFPLLWV